VEHLLVGRQAVEHLLVGRQAVEHLLVDHRLGEVGLPIFVVAFPWCRTFLQEP
jgi:hypothetical protein